MPGPHSTTVLAPATIGNVGPGFDSLGLAISGLGDRVTATRASHDAVRITGVEGDGGVIPTDAARNTAGIAAEHTRRRAGRADAGIDLHIVKGIPLESGLGGSAASAAAAAFAVNLLLGAPLRKMDLIDPCVEAEAAVAGRHADNVAPALLGGLVLVQLSDVGVRAQRIPVPPGLIVVVVTPDHRVPTRDARSALPEQISIAARTRNASNLALMVSACYSGELGLLGTCIEDDVVTPARLDLIPGGADAMAAAHRHGALATSISGAGPSMFSFCHSEPTAVKVRDAMIEAFEAHDLKATGIVSPADCPGVRALAPSATERTT